MSDRIRVVALGVVCRDGDSGDERDAEPESDEELLVAEERDPRSGGVFYRPLGGGVEFGEHSEDALRREFREELGVELESVSSLETYEDVFSYDGRQQHEVWRVYEADIAESWPYEDDEFTASEPDLDEEIACVWKSFAEFENGDTLYPESLLAALAQAQ